MDMTYLLIILIFVGLLLWGFYRTLSPMLKTYRQIFGTGAKYSGGKVHGGNFDRKESGKHQRPVTDEEQSSVDLINETNMDLEGGEYVDYEEVK